MVSPPRLIRPVTPNTFGNSVPKLSISGDFLSSTYLLFHSFIIILCVRVHIPWMMCGRQRLTCGSHSPLGFGLLGLAAKDLFLLSRLWTLSFLLRGTFFLKKRVWMQCLTITNYAVDFPHVKKSQGPHIQCAVNELCPGKAPLCSRHFPGSVSMRWPLYRERLFSELSSYIW